MRRRKGVVRNSNIFMDRLSKATKAFSEVQLYNVNKRYVKQVFQVPIDIRFLQVENIIRKAINRKEGIQQAPTLTDLIPLELSAYFIYNYIRSVTALKSDYRKLYVSPHMKTSGDLPTWSFLEPGKNYRVDSDYIKNSSYGDYLTQEELSLLENILVSIEEDLSNELTDKVILMEICGYTLNIYSLGSILEYRMLELDNAILKVPNGENCADYFNTRPSNVCTATYKIY